MHIPYATVCKPIGFHGKKLNKAFKKKKITPKYWSKVGVSSRSLIYNF